MDPLSLSEGYLIDTEGHIYALSDILAISFIINFDEPSKISFMIKKSDQTSTWIQFWLLIFLLIFGIPIELLISYFSFSLAYIIALYSMFKIFPKYWRKYKEVNQIGFKQYHFDDVVSFAKLQKNIFEDYHGRKLIKRGFIFGEHTEKFLFAFMPAFIYNCSAFRQWAYSVTRVAYPAFIAFLTFLICGLKLFGFLIRGIRNDVVISMVIDFLRSFTLINICITPFIFTLECLWVLFSYLCEGLDLIFEKIWMVVVLILVPFEYFKTGIRNFYRAISPSLRIFKVWIEKNRLYKNYKEFKNKYKTINKEIVTLKEENIIDKPSIVH